jgi:hypothetical protein
VARRAEPRRAAPAPPRPIDVNEAPRPPGERVNAELKNWKILRKIRSSLNNADKLIAAVQTLMIACA